MGNRIEPSPTVEQPPPPSASGWGHLTRIVFRFVFTYWLLYSLQLVLRFPTQLAWMTFSVPQGSATPTDMPEWLAATLKYLAYPGMWFQRGMDWFTPWISYRLLGVEVERPTRFSGSGDRLYDYCTCFAFLVLALALLQAYQRARTQGILAPENPLADRWVGKEFVRDGQKVPFPDLSKSVFSYALLPHKKGAPPLWRGERVHFSTWRGPEASPAPAIAKKLQGTEKTVEFSSKSLGTTRTVKVYLPPRHARSRPAAVIYATDGMLDSELIEPLIKTGKIRPVLVIAAASGGYLGDAKAIEASDIKKDLRAMEYLPGIDDERFAKHERFFCEELREWAEREFGASNERKDCAVFGVSNGARFALEMGRRHPDRFGHVFAFSVAGRNREVLLKTDVPPHFYLAAGVWEKAFHRITTEATDKLKKQKVPVEFHSRFSGHDDAMWREELVAAVGQAFANDPVNRKPRRKEAAE